MAASGSGMFIRCEVDEPAASDPAIAKQLAGVCPVDIYADDAGRVRIVDENLDECILCGLCLDIGPAGAVRVLKLYDGDRPLEKSATA
jgi:NAD-dependent dihydropyrimidine dehydrogenase PreA subunit